MNKQVRLIKEDEKGKTYQAHDFKIMYRYKGTISGDNSINPEELIYLIDGKAEFTLNGESWVVTAPSMVFFPAKTYHKIYAISDISFIITNNKQL